MLCVPHLERWGVPETPEDLLHHCCINHVVQQTGRIREWQFQRNGQSFSVKVSGTFTIDHAETATEAAIAGAGITQLYNFVVGSAIATGQLIPILQDYAAPGVPIAVIYAQKRYLSAKVKVFVEFITELMVKLKRDRIVE
jgi:LysR family transcriptional regulator for bpeEF and oprC